MALRGEARATNIRLTQSSPSAFLAAPASLNEGLSVVLQGSRLRALSGAVFAAHAVLRSF